MSCTASRSNDPFIEGDLPQKVAEALRRRTYDESRRAQMCPEMSYGRHRGPAPCTARRAAVIVLLFCREGRWHLPLTERASGLLRHGGQISLPGGAIDRNESAEEAAKRELGEELGITAGVQLLGQLEDCYVFASDFVVTPYVAMINQDPQWQPHTREVQRVIEMPLATMLDDSARAITTIQRGPLVFRAPGLQFGSAFIWGATAVILGELVDVLHDRHVFTPIPAA